jgi:predicted dehydrogenase
MRIVVVGAGSVGQRHIRNLLKILPDVKLGVVRRRGRGVVLDAFNNVISDIGVAEYYGLEEFSEVKIAIAEFNPDGLIIAGPTSTHFEDALQSLTNGLPTLVEKPLCTSMQEFDTLAEAERTFCSGGLFVGFQYRYHPVFRELTRLSQTAELGDLLSARFLNQESIELWHPYESYKDSYALWHAKGGGALLTQMHEIDMACSLFGDYGRVYALGGKISTLAGDAEDIVSILSSFTNKRKMRVPVGFTFDFLRNPPVRQAEIMFQSGMVVADFLQSTISISKDGASSRILEYKSFDRNTMFEMELSDFLGYLAGGLGPPVGVDEARRSFRFVCEAKGQIGGGLDV